METSRKEMKVSILSQAMRAMRASMAINVSNKGMMEVEKSKHLGNKLEESKI